MIRRPPRSTRTDTLFPYTTLFRSGLHLSATWIHRLNGSQFRRQAVRIIRREIQRNEWKERHAKLRFSSRAVDKSRLADHYAARRCDRYNGLPGGKASGYIPEERQVGKERVRPCSYRGSPAHNQ